MTTALFIAAAVVAPSAGGAPLLSLPIACRPGHDCEIQNLMDRDPGPAARDYRCGSMTYDGHTGLDIRLPDLVAQRRGVAVLAAADGQVLRVRDDVPDISVTQVGAEAIKGRECGNGLVIAHAGGLTTQYCHMAQGGILVRPGQVVKTGQALGRVGLSGNTEYPHLHFTVRLNDTVIDPFAPDPGAAGSCGSGPSLWRPDAEAQLAYKAGAILNVGFAAGPVDMAGVEDGALPAPTRTSPILVAYARGLSLKAGDRQEMAIMAPDGRVLAESKGEPLPRSQAHRLLYIGKPRPAGGWTSGRYEAVYRIVRDGRTLVERRWSLVL